MCILEARGNEEGFYGARDRQYLPLYFATTLGLFYSATEMKREENNLCSAEQQDSISF